MKKFGFLTVLILCLANFNVLQAQETDAVFQKVATAIQAKDAAALSAMLNSSVELTVPGINDGAYAVKQAQFVISDFFTKYPVTSFKIIKKGSTGNTFYAVGIYTSAKGSFDTNIFVRNMGGTFLVTQIRFEAED